MFFVYILWSVKSNSTYVGQTEDLENRLKRHNAGLVRSTKSKLPWILIHFETYNTRAEAVKKETWLKSKSGRLWLKSFIEQWKEKGLSVPISQSDIGTRSRGAFSTTD